MKTRATLNYLLGLGAVLIMLFCGGCGRRVSVPGFASITNIVFTVKGGPSANDWRHFIVSDTNELRRLISFTHVRVKEPCNCLHLCEALVQSPSGDTQISFCPHCFDIVGGQLAGDYRMPSDFYDEFQRLARKTTP